MTNTEPQTKSSPLRDVRWWVWVVLALICLFALWLAWLLLRLAGFAWNEFTALDKTVAAAIVAGVFTVLATTITVMVGRYFEERRKNLELHRDRKIKMYDQFIARIFNMFSNDSESKDETDKTELVEFLREHQRQFLLWSSPGVIRAYSEWRKTLTDEPNVQTVMQMEKFFLAVRRDLGHSNWGIKSGDTARFLIRHMDFMLEQAAKNPNLTLGEIAKLEDELGLNDPYDG